MPGSSSGMTRVARVGSEKRTPPARIEATGQLTTGELAELRGVARLVSPGGVGRGLRQLAPSGRTSYLAAVPLLGGNQPCRRDALTAGFDPFRTSSRQFCCDAHIAVGWNGPGPSGVLGAVGPG